MVAACSDVVAGWAIQIEGESVVVEARPIFEYEARQRPKALADPVKLGFSIRELKPQPLVYVLIEVLEQLSGACRPSACGFARPSPLATCGTRSRFLPACGTPGRW